MKHVKKYVVCLGALLIMAMNTSAADEEIRTVGKFSKLMVGPLIDVVLTKGDSESIRIVADQVELSKINTKKSGKTLKIFLDNARMGTNTEKLVDPEKPNVLIRRSRYHGARVTVYVTYHQLERLEVRGEGSLVCDDRLGADKFKLKLMGEVNADISAVDARRFVISAMGANDIFIHGGAADKQVYRIYGESQVHTTKVNSTFAKVTVYGEGEVRISTDDTLKLKTVGESTIYYKGDPSVTKSLILGDVTIRAL